MERKLDAWIRDRTDNKRRTSKRVAIAPYHKGLLTFGRRIYSRGCCLLLGVGPKIGPGVAYFWGLLIERGYLLLGGLNHL